MGGISAVVREINLLNNKDNLSIKYMLDSWRAVIKISINGLFNNDRLMIRRPEKIIIIFGIFLLGLIWAGLVYKSDTERQHKIDTAITQTENYALIFEEHTAQTRINQVKNALEADTDD